MGITPPSGQPPGQQPGRFQRAINAYQNVAPTWQRVAIGGAIVAAIGVLAFAAATFRNAGNASRFVANEGIPAAADNYYRKKDALSRAAGNQTGIFYAGPLDYVGPGRESWRLNCEQYMEAPSGEDVTVVLAYRNRRVLARLRNAQRYAQDFSSGRIGAVELQGSEKQETRRTTCVDSYDGFYKIVGR